MEARIETALGLVRSIHGKATKIEEAIDFVRTLHGVAIDKGARKSLKKALASLQNALDCYNDHAPKAPIRPLAFDKITRKNLKLAISYLQHALKIYAHPNLKAQVKPQRKMPNPQQRKYRWHK